jgi:hypothetical protein
MCRTYYWEALNIKDSIWKPLSTYTWQMLPPSAYTRILGRTHTLPVEYIRDAIILPIVWLFVHLENLFQDSSLKRSTCYPISAVFIVFECHEFSILNDEIVTPLMQASPSGTIAQSSVATCLNESKWYELHFNAIRFSGGSVDKNAVSHKFGN